MSDRLISRAELLMQQSRFDEAGKILSEVLATEPDNIYILAMLSQVKLSQNKTSEAEELINSAIAINPEVDFLYYVKSRIAISLDRYDEAEELLREALVLNSEDADYYSLLASIKLDRKKYQEALDLADRALEVDAENILGLNIRSTALLKLNRKQEATATIQGALSEDPNNAYTHSNYGWSLLEQGDSKTALVHFREALRNDPDLDHAQAGMAEALKARYLFYRLFLKYSFWISNLTSKYQWGVIIGFFFVTKFLRNVAASNDTIQPYLQPVIILLMLVAFSTWVMQPVSNLFLRLNTYGKHLLSNKEKLSSNFVGLSLLIFIVAILTYMLGAGEKWLAPAAFGFTMMVPFSVMFSPSRFKYSLIIYAVVMFCIGSAAIWETFDSGELFNAFTPIFIFGFVAFQWLANFLMIRESNR